MGILDIEKLESAYQRLTGVQEIKYSDGDTGYHTTSVNYKGNNEARIRIYKDEKNSGSLEIDIAKPDESRLVIGSVSTDLELEDLGVLFNFGEALGIESILEATNEKVSGIVNILNNMIKTNGFIS